MGTEVIKNVADATVVSGVFVGWLSHLPDIAAGFALVYTIVRLIIEWPALKTAVRKWFK